MNEEIKQSRDYNADFLKIFACLLVIINHTSVPFRRYVEVNAPWKAAATLFYFSKSAVPIFLMITGMFIFSKTRGYEYSLKKFGHFFGLLILWNYLFWVMDNGFDRMFNIGDYIYATWTVPNGAHLWYLYTLAGFYLILPLMEKLVGQMKKRDYHYFLLLWVIFTTILPMITVLYELEPMYFNFQVNLVVGLIGFFILGHYLKMYPINGFIALGMVIIGLISSVIITTHMSEVDGQLYTNLDNVSLLPLVLTSVGLYQLLRNIKINRGRVFTWIADLTFGIYLIHILLIRELNKLEFVQKFLNQTDYKLIGAYLVYDLVIFILSAVIIFLLKKVPYVNKLIS